MSEPKFKVGEQVTVRHLPGVFTIESAQDTVPVRYTLRDDYGFPFGGVYQEAALSPVGRLLRVAETPTPDGSGLRFDDGKPRYDLLPPEALEDLTRLYTAGAAKYGERNWEGGMRWSRCYASMMRHAWSWFRGEDFDPETGAHHMIAVAWNALALVTYHHRKVGRDDRPALSRQECCAQRNAGACSTSADDGAAPVLPLPRR